MDDSIKTVLVRIAEALEAGVRQQADMMETLRVTREAVDSVADALHAIFDEFADHNRTLDDLTQAAAEVSSSMHSR